MSHIYGEAEAFINDIFWSDSHDKTNKINIQEVMAAKLHKDNQEKDPDYYNHRPGVIHVSSLGKCLRGVVHEMIGTPKDEQDAASVARKLGVFRAGNLFEEYIVESLSEYMLDRQTEYVYFSDGVYLTGRDDGTMSYEGERRMLECKSVHTDSFWHRQKEGTLVAYQNQMQIQTYLWLRRILPNVFHRSHFDLAGNLLDTEIIYTNLDKQALWEYRGSRPDDKLVLVEKPDDSNLNGIFTYISKDDCMVAQAPVKFSPRIIDETILPALALIKQGYTARDPNLVPAPPITRYDPSRNQHVKSWLCGYCDYHSKCAGAGWVAEASAEVTRKNKDMQMPNPFAVKAGTPKIAIAIPVAPLAEAMGVRVAENGALVNAELGVEVSPARQKIRDMVGMTAIPTKMPEGETVVERMMRESREKNS